MAFVEIWSQRVLNYRAFTTCSTLFPDPQQLLLFRRWVTKGGRWLWKGHGVIQEAISLGFTHSGISRRCDRHPLESDRALKRILPAVTSTDCIMIMVASFSSVTMLMNSMVNDRLAWWLMMNMRGCMTSGSSLCSYWCLWGRPWQRVSDRMVALKVFSFTAWNIKDTELPRIHIYLHERDFKATFSWRTSNIQKRDIFGDISNLSEKINVHKRFVTISRWFSQCAMRLRNYFKPDARLKLLVSFQIESSLRKILGSSL